MSRISRILFASIVALSSDVRETHGLATTTTSSRHSVSRPKSSLSVSNALDIYDDVDYVQSLEDKLIHFANIDDDNVRRNDFEVFVTGRLQEELAFLTNQAAKSTVERLKLKSLSFVQAMDKSILKLGQSAQNQGWENHVTSGFPQQQQQQQPKGNNDIWPYVDMLIQFKLLISNMERMSNKKASEKTIARNDTGGCNKCAQCPGFGSCNKKTKH